MDFSIDLRFLCPPLLNLMIFMLYLKSQDGNSWDLQDGTSKILLYPILEMQFPVLILAMLLLLLFLLTAIRLPLTARRPIFSRNRSGELSILLALLMLASFIFAPSLFLVPYLCLILLSVCYATVASIFKRFFNWCKSNPDNIIASINNNVQEDPEAAARQVELSVDIQGLV